MTKWLAIFAYREEMQWLMLAETGLAALTVALLTVSSQAIKAAVMIPVKSLKRD